MSKWVSNQLYPNIFFRKISNEEEYFQAVRELFDTYPVLYSWSVDQWEEKVHLFDEDYEGWHSFFVTECMYDDEVDELPNPQTYTGEIRNKPEDLSYPALLMFTNEVGRLILWQSLSELE